MDNSPVCVDASLVARLLIPYDDKDAIHDLWVSWMKERRLLVAPSLLAYEITNVLHRYTAYGELSPEEADKALEIVTKLGIELHDGIELHRQALLLARRLSLPAAYDAHYLALAERLGAEFWTADQKLVQATGNVFPWVNHI